PGTFGNITGLLNSTCSGICQAGYYCPSGSTSANQTACPVGFYCPDQSGMPTSCPASTYNPVKEAPSSDSCILCPPNSYGPNSGAASCVNCSLGYYNPYSGST